MGKFKYNPITGDLELEQEGKAAQAQPIIKHEVNQAGQQVYINLTPDSCHEVTIYNSSAIVTVSVSGAYRNLPQNYELHLLTTGGTPTIQFTQVIRWVKPLEIEPNKHYVIIIDHNKIAVWVAVDNTLTQTTEE